MTSAPPDHPLKTPLWALIVQDASDDMLRAALAHGADPNAASPDGHTPLLLAVVFDRPTVVVMLLDAGADPRVANPAGRTPLIAAASDGIEAEEAFEIVRVLIEHGSDVHHADNSGSTALMEAETGNRNALVALLRSVLDQEALQRAASGTQPSEAAQKPRRM